MVVKAAAKTPKISGPKILINLLEQSTNLKLQTNLEIATASNALFAKTSSKSFGVNF